MPGPLPQGERILWQGSPDWRVLTRRVFHVRGLFIYFGILVAYATANSFSRGGSLADVALDAAKFAGLALVPLALLTLYAWATARATTYTVTNRRVAIRMGIAMPMTLNLPFARIDGAAFRPARDGTGDITLQMAKGDRVAYLVLWPHARPWHVARTEPMLRAIPHAEKVAQLLSRALAASADAPAPALDQLQGGAGAANIGPARPQAAAAA